MGQRDTDIRADWERMRLLACIMIQPNLKRGKKITPEKLLPLPWDKKQTGKGKKLTAAEQRKRMAALVEKLGDKI